MSEKTTTARIVPGLTDEALARASRVTRLELTRLVTRIITKSEGEVVKRAPVGHSHALAGGYRSEVRGGMTATVRGLLINPVLYHDYVEEGRGPGKRPPVHALMPWVASKLGVPQGPARRQAAFAIARAIGARGTEGAHMVEEGWRVTRGFIRPEMEKMGLRIASEISR